MLYMNTFMKRIKIIIIITVCHGELPKTGGVCTAVASSPNLDKDIMRCNHNFLKEHRAIRT